MWDAPSYATDSLVNNFDFIANQLNSKLCDVHLLHHAGDITMCMMHSLHSAAGFAGCLKPEGNAGSICCFGLIASSETL